MFSYLYCTKCLTHYAILMHWKVCMQVALSICQFGSMWKWKKPYKDLDWWFRDFVELSGDKMMGILFINIYKSSKNKLQTLQFINNHMLSQIQHLCNVG
jgi:hypothetical protein